MEIKSQGRSMKPKISNYYNYFYDSQSITSMYGTIYLFTRKLETDEGEFLLGMSSSKVFQR